MSVACLLVAHLRASEAAKKISLRKMKQKRNSVANASKWRWQALKTAPRPKRRNAFACLHVREALSSFRPSVYERTTCRPSTNRNPQVERTCETPRPPPFISDITQHTTQRRREPPLSLSLIPRPHSNSHFPNDELLHFLGCSLFVLVLEVRAVAA